MKICCHIRQRSKRDLDCRGITGALGATTGRLPGWGAMLACLCQPSNAGRCLSDAPSGQMSVSESLPSPVQANLLSFQCIHHSRFRSHIRHLCRTDPCSPQGSCQKQLRQKDLHRLMSTPGEEKTLCKGPIRFSIRTEGYP